ncbi:MAG: hypothetical protein WCR47_06680, partial [Desulfoplanes sp.]
MSWSVIIVIALYRIKDEEMRSKDDIKCLGAQVLIPSMSGVSFFNLFIHLAEVLFPHQDFSRTNFQSRTAVQSRTRAGLTRALSA